VTQSRDAPQQSSALRATGAGSTGSGRLPALPATGLMLVVAGAALVWDSQGFNGFVAAKAATSGAGLALVVLWLARRSALAAPRGRWMPAVAALGGLMLAATVASGSILRSLLGAPLRQEGLLAWAGFAVAFTVGLSLRRTSRAAAAASLVDAAVVAVAAVGAAGVLEAAGVEFDADLIEFRGRVRSTLGNPALLAGFMVLVGPVASVAVARRGPWRWAGGSAAVLAAVNLAAAQTRAVWAAVVVVGVAAALLAAGRRVRLLVAAAALSAAAAAALSGRWAQFGHDLRGRAAIWEVAASAVVDDPLLGNGPETFLATYGERVSEDTVREYGIGAVDRAHSGLLDFAVSFGAPAGVLYLVALAGVAVLALNAVRSGDTFRVAAGVGVACYAVAQQAFFAHPSTDTVWWLMVGFLVADSGAATRRLPPLGAALLLSAASVLTVNALSLARNDRLYEQSVESPTAVEAYERLAQAASHRPFDDLSYVLMGELLSQTDDIRVVADGIGRIRGGAGHNPGNGLVALALIDAQMQAHRITSDPAHAVEARLAADELIAAQPANGPAYLKRGVAAWSLGHRAAARSDWERAAFLMPDRPEPRQNLAVLDAAEADRARSRGPARRSSGGRGPQGGQRRVHADTARTAGPDTAGTAGPDTAR